MYRIGDATKGLTSEDSNSSPTSPGSEIGETHQQNRSPVAKSPLYVIKGRVMQLLVQSDFNSKIS